MNYNESGGTRTTNADPFESFFEGWLVRQEHFLDELLYAERHCHESTDDDLRDLVSRVLAHYQQYYEDKSRLAQRNIFLVFSPTWFSTLERSFFWIAGFNPLLAFRIVRDSVHDLSEEQSRRISRLVDETRVEEKALNDELAKIHESLAMPPMLELARRRGRLIEDEIDGEAEALREFEAALQTVVANADLLRTTTATRVVELLNPAQNVKFFAAVTKLQLKIRSKGLQREAERRESQDTGYTYL